jgi:hypothetical protein
MFCSSTVGRNNQGATLDDFRTSAVDNPPVEILAVGCGTQRAIVQFTTGANADA